MMHSAHFCLFLQHSATFLLIQDLVFYQPLKQFLNKQIFQKWQKICVIAKLVNFFFLTNYCLKSHQWVTPSNQKKEFWTYHHLFRSYRSSKVMSVNFTVIRSIASSDSTKNAWWFLASCFPMVYNMNDFAVIIFSHYYTLMCKIGISVFSNAYF